ncbi:MAG: hypothetical protein RBT67_07585 [Thauera sp.]|nr:hypothetical protein [Thauera sp.]
MDKATFTTKQLAELLIPGMPKTAEGWRGIALAEKWDCFEQPGRGRGGVKREYVPPPELLELIRRHMRGEVVTEEEVNRARAIRSVAFRKAPAGLADYQQAPGRDQRTQAASAPDADERLAASAAQAFEPSAKTLPEFPVALALALGRAIQSGGWAPPDLPLEKCDHIVRQALAAIGLTFTAQQQSALLRSEAGLDAALRVAFEVLRQEW